MSNGDIRLRNFDQLVEENNDQYSIQLPKLIEKLILYENLIIESKRLKEIPLLINSVGYESTMALLKSGAIQIHNDKLSIGSKDKERMHLLGFSEFKAFGMEPNQLFKNNIQEIKDDCDISDSKFRRLENKLNEVVSSYPEELLSEFLENFRRDVRPNSDYLRQAIKIKTKQELNREIDINQIEVNTTRVNNDLYKHESNLKELLNIEKGKEYEILDRSILSLGGLNEKILQMDIYNCISGFKTSEISIFSDKLKFLENEFGSEDREEQLHRAVEIAGLPNINDAVIDDINIENLLELRQEDEIVAFRNWLYSTDNFTDEELEEMLNSFQAKLSKFINTGWGKTINFLVSNGIGAIPGVGQILGAGYSLADTFLLEKILKQPGAITFLNESYPTIFQE